MLSRFHLIPGRHGQTDRRTDGQNCYINIARHLFVVASYRTCDHSFSDTISPVSVEYPSDATHRHHYHHHHHHHHHHHRVANTAVACERFVARLPGLL